MLEFFYFRYPGYTVLSNADAAFTAKTQHERFNENTLIGVNIDLNLLSMCDYVVCTLSSNVSVCVIFVFYSYGIFSLAIQRTGELSSASPPVKQNVQLVHNFNTIWDVYMKLRMCFQYQNLHHYHQTNYGTFLCFFINKNMHLVHKSEITWDINSNLIYIRFYNLYHRHQDL